MQYISRVNFQKQLILDKFLYKFLLQHFCIKCSIFRKKKIEVTTRKDIFYVNDNKELESRNNGRNMFYDFLFSRTIK